MDPNDDKLVKSGFEGWWSDQLKLKNQVEKTHTVLESSDSMPGPALSDKMYLQNKVLFSLEEKANNSIINP